MPGTDLQWLAGKSHDITIKRFLWSLLFDRAVQRSRGSKGVLKTKQG